MLSEWTNDNREGAHPAIQHPRWALAVIVAGVLLSVLWSASLLYGAYLLGRWPLN
jgi:hypothetical protein